MDDVVFLRSEDGLHFEECSCGEQYANGLTIVLPKEQYTQEATESDYIDALQDLGVDVE